SETQKTVDVGDVAINLARRIHDGRTGCKADAGAQLRLGRWLRALSADCPSRDANILEVLISHMGEGREVTAVPGEALSVLGRSDRCAMAVVKGIRSGPVEHTV